jgi:hypothetical protein
LSPSHLRRVATHMRLRREPAPKGDSAAGALRHQMMNG